MDRKAAAGGSTTNPSGAAQLTSNTPTNKPLIISDTQKAMPLYPRSAPNYNTMLTPAPAPAPAPAPPTTADLMMAARNYDGMITPKPNPMDTMATMRGSSTGDLDHHHHPQDRDVEPWRRGYGRRSGEMGGGMFSMSDDTMVMKTLMETHVPDPRRIEVTPLLLLVQEILNHATMHVDNIVKGNLVQMDLEERVHQPNFAMTLDYVNPTIEHILCEMQCKALSGADAHGITMAIFRQPLSSYTWDAKLVLALAAFALNYGEFWLLAQIYSNNTLAKSMAILRQVVTILERSAPLKPWFEILNSLIKACLDVAITVVHLHELDPAYISDQTPEYLTAIKVIPNAVYWTVRILVTCAAQITALKSMGREFAVTTMEEWELRNLLQKLKAIHEHLQEQLGRCNMRIQDAREEEWYRKMMESTTSIQIDNLVFLRLFIRQPEDRPALYDPTNKKHVHLEVLKRKNVLLLVSGLNIERDEILILEQFYSESRQNPLRPESQFEVVWVPIVEDDPWTDEHERLFLDLQSAMTWFTVHPSQIRRPSIKFSKEYLHFKNRPILVVIDPQGRIVNHNAMHMMWIWGNHAFPFTKVREEALWAQEPWRLELLVEFIDPTILNWAREGKYIFVFGSDDLEWVRKFCANARKAAQESRISLELVYVGKNGHNVREQVKRVMEAVTKEKLAYTWPDHSLVWYFWTRLESMLFSKYQLKQGMEDPADKPMQQIKKLLFQDKTGGWALLSKGSDVVNIAASKTALDALLEHPSWVPRVPIEGFDVVWLDVVRRLTTHQCLRMEFREQNLPAKMPHAVECPECRRSMEKHITYMCCHGHHELDDQL